MSERDYTVTESTIIFDEFFRIERAKVKWKRSDGSMGREVTRYVIRRGDSVGIIPVCGESIIMVRQFRYPAARKEVNPYLWEIPAGMVDKGEKPELTALRELKEEIGIEVSSIKPLISFFLSPGALDEMFHLFYVDLKSCDDLKKIGGVEEEEEDLLVGRFTRTDILKMIDTGEIVDSKTIASLLYYFSKFPE